MRPSKKIKILLRLTIFGYRKLIILTFFLLYSFGMCFAEVFQYKIVINRLEKNTEIASFLYLPPESKQIRGLLVGGQIVFEQDFVNDPHIREVCKRQNLGIIYFAPQHLDAIFDWQPDENGKKNNRCDEDFLKILDNFAEVSNHPELRIVPFFPFGHSVASIFMKNFVSRFPARCFGALGFKGAFIPIDETGFDLPVLAIKGQFEEFGSGPDGFLRDDETREISGREMLGGLMIRRRKDNRFLVSMLLEPGGTHFAWSESQALYTAKFIEAAARLRIPAFDSNQKNPVECIVLAPESGALSDGDLHAPKFQAALYHQYKGDPKKALWHPTLELAKLNEEFHKGLNKKHQFVTFCSSFDKTQVIFTDHDLRLRMGNPSWISADAFMVDALFLDSPPDKYPPVEGLVSHSDSPIKFRNFGGAIKRISHNVFRVTLDGRSSLRVNIMAYNDGDHVYRYCEQMGRMDLPVKLTDGADNHITFEVEPVLKVDFGEYELSGISSSGLPVRYYIEYGPAKIIESGETNKLVLSEVPAKANYPLEVSIIAYQYGSAVEPFVKSAEMVRRVIRIENTSCIQLVEPEKHVVLRNETASLSIDLYGGAIIDFHLKGMNVNPFTWELLPHEMPENNQKGAAFNGHFLCLGRWGAPTEGKILSTIGRLFNVVQHVTIGTPFLAGSTMIDCNAGKGFMQHLSYPDPERYACELPAAEKKKSFRE